MGRGCAFCFGDKDSGPQFPEISGDAEVPSFRAFRVYRVWGLQFSTGL